MHRSIALSVLNKHGIFKLKKCVVQTKPVPKYARKGTTYAVCNANSASDADGSSFGCTYGNLERNNRLELIAHGFCF